VSAPRAISFVGRSGSGKTTLLEGVIEALVVRGLRVGTIKHHGHDIELDVPHKDSWRHARAGAVATIVSNPSQVALFRRVHDELALADLVELMSEVDVVLVEGFRAEATQCVEVVRAANSSQPVCAAEQIAVLVTDVPIDTLPETLRDAIGRGSVAVFGVNDVEGVAAAIADGPAWTSMERSNK